MSSHQETMSFTLQAGSQMEALLGDLGRLYKERNDALREVALAHHEALMRLARAAELRDDDTGVHIVRIGYLAEALALAVGSEPAWAKQLRHAAPMHDLGKLGISDSVLKKPGPLSPEERREMNEHPRIGAEILGRSRIGLFRLAAEVAYTHHERWDGAGYPNQLAGQAIPLSGRIVAVVDFYDALRMARCYRPAFCESETLDMLMAQRGKAFDPHVVDVFLSNAQSFAALRDRLDNAKLDFDDLMAQAPEHLSDLFATT